jgi:serine/threonine protein kinase
MALQPGDALLGGQYRILHQLGRGGFGFVYLAQDTLLGEEVAIKELIPALVGDEAMLKRFLAEARATMRLTHEHIVRTHNVFSEGGNYYIVMEYLAGGSLEARLQARGQLPVDEAVRVAVQIADGLRYAHQRGVVHCDLKPANILFAANRTAKVADFGIAHVSGEMLTRSWMTSAGFAAGTLPYMSPEQTDGVRDDPRVDVYALGAVLYRMLTGRPYLEFDQRETPAAQAENVYRIHRDLPKPPSAFNRRIPGWLDQVVLRALAKQPGDRYPGADALRVALLRGAAEMPTTPQPAPARRPRAPLPAWLWLLAGGAVAMLVLLIVVVALVAGGNGAGKATTQEPTQVAVVQVTATPSPQPTSTSTPGETTMPAATPSETAMPTAMPSPMPTLTPTPSPSPTQTPTSTPTETPAPPPVDRIAFASNHEGNFDLYGMDADGSNQQRLTNTPAEEWHPAWSPDGTRIVCQCMSGASGSNVCLVNADGSGYTQITRWTADDGRAQRPVWSPDGQKIAVSREGMGTASHSIWVMDADGSNQTQIAEGRDPSWSPDGARIAFIRSDGSGLQIWTVGPDGSDLQKLTEGGHDHMYPTWSPDGRQIAFEYDHAAVAVMDAGGGSPQTVAAKGSWNLSWSPEGSKLVIAPLGEGLWLVDVVGGGQVQIAQNGTQPAWRPVR